MTYKSLTAAVVKEVSIIGLGFFFSYYLSHLYQKKKSHEKNFIDISFNCCLRQPKFVWYFVV